MNKIKAQPKCSVKTGMWGERKIEIIHIRNQRGYLTEPLDIDRIIRRLHEQHSTNKFKLDKMDKFLEGQVLAKPTE